MYQSGPLVIRADLNEIPRVTAVLEEIMGEHGFGREAILDLQLAVEEVVANAIIHGYRGGAGEVAITIHTTNRAMEVRIMDRAPPFNPLSIPEPDLKADLTDRQVGGLGMFLVRHVVDDISYRHAGGKNILTVVKRRPG